MKEVIKLATLSEATKIVDLLNKTTLNLHSKGINQWDYPWNEEEILKDIRKNNVFVFKTDETIGTFSIKDSLSYNGHYLYRIAILPTYQGKGIGNKIVEYAYNYSKEFDKSLYLDCWNGNTKLREFYLKSNFEYLYDIDELDYKVSVFKKE